LFLRNFQALTPPYPEDTFVIYVPTIPAKQCNDPFVTVTPIPGGELDGGCCQRIFIIKLFGVATV